MFNRLKLFKKGSDAIELYFDGTKKGIRLGGCTFSTDGADAQKMALWNDQPFRGVKYDLTSKLDGVTKTIQIDESIKSHMGITFIYSGLTLELGYHFTVNFANHTLTTLFNEALDSNRGRTLILIVD